METTTAIATTGFWASKSKGEKWGIGIGVALSLVAVGYAVYHFVFKEKDEPKKITPPATANVDVAVEAEQPHVETADLTLPNKGVGCSAIVNNYDRDYDYVKCGGVWYTKSKANPSSESAKGKFATWTSLSQNAVATKLLDTRYKNF